ncbi:hypothetical protein [Streptomyces sp. TE33382]
MTDLTTRVTLPVPAGEPRPARPAPTAEQGESTAAAPAEQQSTDRGPKLSQSDVLLHLGMDEYVLVRCDQTAYAVPAEGPPIARPLRAAGGFGGTGSLRQLLNRSYVLRTGRAPSQGCLTDAIASMDALALDAEERPVCLRIAPDPADEQVTWLDLGRSDGLSVCIEPGTWSVTTPPVGEGPLWRRTRLTGELPLPERDPGGWRAGLGLLRELSALAEPSWRMAVAWLLAGLRPDMPRPVAYFNGERGTAKTTSARQLLRVLDGIRAEVRNVPRSEDDGAVAASAGWTMGLDNIHGIPQWLSDFLCRTVTGASVAKREMYTDDDVTSWAYQRPVVLTGIDVGALQPDLAERLLPFTLEAIDPKARRSEHDLWRSYRAAHGRILGGPARTGGRGVGAPARRGRPARPETADGRLGRTALGPGRGHRLGHPGHLYRRPGGDHRRRHRRRPGRHRPHPLGQRHQHHQVAGHHRADRQHPPTARPPPRHLAEDHRAALRPPDLPRPRAAPTRHRHPQTAPHRQRARLPDHPHPRPGPAYLTRHPLA